MAGRRANNVVSERETWSENSRRAERVRANVGQQIAESLRSSEITGGRAFATRRLKQLVVAEQSGDRSALRSAVMEVAIAFAAWCVRLDLGQRGEDGFVPRKSRVAGRK